jgi:hypothetical protein
MDAGPFEEGIIAATDGMPASANPYSDGTSESVNWNRGYHSVMDMPEDADQLDGGSHNQVR